MSLMSLNPGKLDRRLRLQRPYSSRLTDGSVDQSWISVATVSASWIPQSGREFVAAQAVHAEATAVFRIRYRSDITEEWRFAHGSDLFEIVAIQQVGRLNYLDLVVKSIDREQSSVVEVDLLHDLSPVLLHDGSLELLHN